ncbi:metal-dependent hydrolase [Exiguobacterium sp. Leaf196]|jgi:L-ascorbate metabolism protein UlaG (beta-lactamase superfamily)|uniref:metal-dependent hydrolase n=1 Tax=Exiguobacterium sp. Leaf196 TaxID=1736298 RepID=UPI0006FB8E77|nr:metal-dependent hydrolase [Exiguobacterium sp. Leaf196]KQS40175.1 metal-dependent hydrolase [Exiguobacterium sp. Leaf196]
MKLTYHGQSTVTIETNGHHLVIDPFFSGNDKATTNPDDVKADFILLTHAHADHMLDAERIAKATGATIIATHELATYLSFKGLNVHPMNLGGQFEFSFGKVKMTQAFHSSSIIDEEKQTITYMGMPAGFLLTIEGKEIYHAGDTALFGDLALYGAHHEIDLAFLPIGDNFTMGPDDALIAADMLQAKAVIPIHYDTFDLIKQDANAFCEQIEAQGQTGHLLAIGESLEL